MTFHGRIKNGVPVLDAPVELPEGTRVRVEVEPADSAFWDGKPLEELAKDQGIVPLSNLADLSFDWPQEDSLDELLAMVREVRR